MFIFHFNIGQHRNWLAADPHNNQHLILWVSKLQFYFYSDSYALRRWCRLDGILIVCFPNIHSGKQLWILFIDLLNKWIWGRWLISLMRILLKSLCKELAVDSNDRGCSQIMASPASSYLVSPWSHIFFWGLHFFVQINLGTQTNQLLLGLPKFLDNMCQYFEDCPNYVSIFTEKVVKCLWKAVFLLWTSSFLLPLSVVFTSLKLSCLCIECVLEIFSAP